MTNLIPTPSVSLVGNRPATTSFDVADHFGKQHKNVMRDIRNLMAELPEDVRGLNFELAFRTVAGPNNSERQEEYFTVFFDGFILLVMGYTGKKALQIKLAYIGAFNAMREQLAGKPEQPRPLLEPTTRLSKRGDPERKELHALVNTWVGCAPLHYAAANGIVNAYIGVRSVDEMTIEQVQTAISFVQGKITEANSLPAPIPAHPHPQSEAWEADLITLHDEVIRKKLEIEMWLGSLRMRLRDVTGPMFKALTMDIARGTRIVTHERGLCYFHNPADEAAERIRQSMDDMSSSLWKTAWFATAMKARGM